MKDPVATVGIILLIVAAYWAGWMHLGAGLIKAPGSPSNGDEVCAQVVTSARNPGTGLIQQFPTPCDVPEGWEVVENDIPGL